MSNHIETVDESQWVAAPFIEPEPTTVLGKVQRRVKENQEYISWQCKQQADWQTMLRHLTDRF